MRKVFPATTTRKVYSTQATVSPQAGITTLGTSATTVRRLHNNSSLLSPNNSAESPRILKQATITRQMSPATPGTGSNSQPMKCYVCDCFVGGQGSLLMDTVTASTHTKLPNKIGRVIGESFLVIVRADDLVCKRCVALFNQYDQMETQMESIKSQLMGFITKKYSIDGLEDAVTGRAPAPKLQKLNSGQAAESSPAPQSNSVVRKVVAQTMPASPGSRKPPVKIYKCMSCDFTTVDLKHFTPHYTVCPGVGLEGSQPSATYRPTNNHSGASPVIPQTATTTQSTASPASAAGKVLARRPVTQSLQKAESAASGMLSCTSCAFKTRDKAQFDEHVRRHQVKVKPFKCRICSARFEDRETASKHARAHSTEYYKCGTCSVAYRDRNQLIKHFEVHRNDGTGGQQIIIKASSTANAKAGQPKIGAGTQQTGNAGSTQRLLQETIDEACNDGSAAPAETVDAKNINFFSCSICSLTFIQENYYTAHMETHKQPAAGAQQAKKAGANQVSISTASGSPGSNKQPVGTRKTPNGQSLIKGEMNDDLESIFEKMHSDKSGGQQGNEVSSTGIDMPALDQGEEATEDAGQSAGAPVSMPSLDDDGEAVEGATQAAAGGVEEEEVTAGNTSAEGGVPMEIEDIQNSVEGGEQLKFIVNENGQLLQLDNHILTDAEGNQIIVQGADSEHLQQLLQSVAGLEGGTIQMIQGENNQMILVQQDGNEPQLIDASLLNADGQIVIQQSVGGEGELSQDGVTTEQQQDQVQYDASDVAVLAAAAEQHEMLQAAAAEAAAVDESSQEDLGEAASQVQATEGAATEEEDEQEGVQQQPEAGEEVAMQSDENSQAASEQAVSAVGGGDEKVNEEGVASVTDGSSAQVEGEVLSQDGGGANEKGGSNEAEGPSEEATEMSEAGAAEAEGGLGEEQATTAIGATEGDVESQAETQEVVPAREEQKEDFGFF